MKLNSMKTKTLKIVVDYLRLERISRQKFRSQWGEVHTFYRGDLLWVELLGNRVALSLEEREDLRDYIEDTVSQLIPYDIIKEGIQYKIF